jgi:peptidoglycan hydrolase FlgJ
MEIGAKPMSLIASMPPEKAKAELRKAAEGFEEMFLNTFLKAARKASLGEDILGSSAVNSTRDMFDAEITRQASSHSHLGIADAVERQFSARVAYKG